MRDNTNSGTKYPYISEGASGVTVVSRDANGGVDPSALFASGVTPDKTEAMNKVAPMFQIENTSSNGKTWAEAKAACEAKGNGWRLPTQRELYLVHSLGGSLFSLDNQGFGSMVNWGINYQKIAAVHWALTEREDKYWLVGYNWTKDRQRNEFSAWTESGSVDWAWYRCVRTVTSIP